MSCRSWKLKIEQALDDSGCLDLNTQEHLRMCPACRAYHQKLLQLDDLLETSVPHPFSYTDIQQLTNSAAEAAFHPQHRACGRKSLWYSSNLIRRGVWAAACAAAVVIITAVWLLQGTNQQGSAAPEQVFASLPQTIPFDYSMTALVSLPEQSIRSEMQQLLSDARQVSAFLIQLMPSEPAQHTTSLPPNETQ